MEPAAFDALRRWLVAQAAARAGAPVAALAGDGGAAAAALEAAAGRLTARWRGCGASSELLVRRPAPAACPAWLPCGAGSGASGGGACRDTGSQSQRRCLASGHARPCGSRRTGRPDGKLL